MYVTYVYLIDENFIERGIIMKLLAWLLVVISLLTSSRIFAVSSDSEYSLLSTESKIEALEDWLIEQGDLESDIVAISVNTENTEEYLSQLIDLARTYIDSQELDEAEIAVLPAVVFGGMSFFSVDFGSPPCRN